MIDIRRIELLGVLKGQNALGVGSSEEGNRFIELFVKYMQKIFMV